MIMRYLILRTHGIPILFHLVLAGFITILGAYYQEGQKGQRALCPLPFHFSGDGTVVVVHGPFARV